MGAILALILPLLSQLPGAIGGYFKGKQELEALKQQAQIEIQKANVQLAGEMAKARLEFQREALRATGKRFKYFTFCMWFGPYMAQLIYPPLGHQIFENMAGMPEWYAQSCITILFTIWGISVSEPIITSIFGEIREFFNERKIIKAAMSANVDNEALFTLIRSLMPNNKLTQDQVDKINKELR